MAALSYRSPPDRRYAALALTALVHALLLLGWQATRRLPVPDALPDAARIQWIMLAPPVPAPAAHRRAAPAQAPARTHAPERSQARARAPAAAAVPATPAPITLVTPSAPAAPTASAAPAPQPAPPATADAPLLQRALREAGAVDRALRKENNPYIVAPPDSPQIRLRKGMEAANEMAPNAWYQAPKVAELVNNTGDGARRTRVGGSGGYCITDRATNTSIDMIEKHGKQRITNCPAHESTAGSQEWKTARDP